jgi:hypothetical protein
MGTAEGGAAWQAATVIKMRYQNFEPEIDQCFEQARLNMASLAGDSTAHKRSEQALTQRRASQHVANSKPEWDGALHLIAI